MGPCLHGPSQQGAQILDFGTWGKGVRELLNSVITAQIEQKIPLAPVKRWLKVCPAAKPTAPPLAPTPAWSLARSGRSGIAGVKGRRWAPSEQRAWRWTGSMYGVTNQSIS